MMSLTCCVCVQNLVDDIVPHFWQYLEEDGPHVRIEVNR